MADQERKVYSFKSVGIKESDRQSRDQNQGGDLPVGIKTPMRLSSDHSELFQMHTNLKDQIRDNFRNMIATNHGDRLMIYDFGANLLPLATELGAESVDTEAIRRISSTTSKYMPYIALETFESFNRPSPDGSLAQVGIRVVYSVPSLNVSNQVVEAIIYSAG